MPPTVAVHVCDMCVGAANIQHVTNHSELAETKRSPNAGARRRPHLAPWIQGVKDKERHNVRSQRLNNSNTQPLDRVHLVSYLRANPAAQHLMWSTPTLMPWSRPVNVSGFGGPSSLYL